MHTKDVAEAVGMPDEKDKEFIRNLIRAYEKKHPGRLKYTVEEAKKDMRENSTSFNDVSEYGEVAPSRAGRHIFELPEELVLKIEKYYPSMFRNEKHFRWFVKNFKGLMLPEKY